ncbi:MAG: hypothetical protein LCI03_12190 [Actinobacteria bacterium]|jgi:hypothetical protein|nr:hypothetical protein [Actinomycetota bacterium]
MTALHLFPELEDSLRRVPGVRKARVVTDGEGRPTEIHVITDTRKPPKDFVRDVQAVALTHYDLALDHRIVSVVQMDETEADSVDVGDATPAAEEPVSPSQADPRPALTSINVMRQNGDAVVTVTLGISGMLFTGQSQGPAAPVHRPRIVAQATLQALTDLLGIPAQVESSQVVEAGLREVALSVITLEIPRLGEQVLCGSALVRGDEEDAVARSVLAAVNRKLSG